MDEVFYRGPGPRVLCTVGIDSFDDDDLASIEAGLDRARDDGLVIQLYGHVPGVTFPVERVEAIAAGAAARRLTSFTYAQLADGVAPTAGLALSFDDRAIDEWFALADVLDRYQVHATFFVTRYHLWTDDDKAKLHALAARGHDVEAHSVVHLRAPEYVEELGLARYVTDEVLPSLDRLRADGFAPRVFAYPFGARTGELDRAILEHVELVRSVSFAFGDPIVSDPCPG